MKSYARSYFSDFFAASAGAGHAFPFWKARVALYCLLRAMEVKSGDEVIVPGYTCVMDVNPIMYLGAIPRYADIDPDTYNVDPESVRSLVSEHTRVIIAQHTYGIPAPMDELRAIAQECGAWLIEDCCLAIGSTYRGQKVGTFGDAAYWSFQWNKVFTTGLGGMATTVNDGLAERIKTVTSAEAEPPSYQSALILTLQRLVHTALIWPRTSALAREVFRRLSSTGLAIGSSDPSEFRPKMPDGFFRTMSEGQAKAGIKRLKQLDSNLAHRRKMAEVYAQLLRDKGWEPLATAEEHDPVLVGYPVRVQDKDHVLAQAPGKMVELGSWFESPLHPYETPLGEYGYEWGMCPVADKACREVVMLPTHPRTTEKDAKRVVDFLTTNTQQAV